MKTKRVTTSNRLGTYLTATVGTSLLAAVQSDAAIVTIDLGPTGFDIAGPNGNALGSVNGAYHFPMVDGGGLYVANGSHSQYGLFGTDGLDFASAGADATPTKFLSGEWIGCEANFNNDRNNTLFSSNGYNAPDFVQNNYMGFKTAQGNYGWLEVKWTDSTNEFQILRGAYEDRAEVPIKAGDIGAIPEPVSMLSTMGMLASGLLIRRRKLAA